MHTDAQNYSFPTVNNEVSAEQPPTSVDTQNILTSTSVRLRENILIP
jgi:hypothetical protein